MFLRIIRLPIAALLGLLVLHGSIAQATRATIDLRTGPLINSSEVSNLALAVSVEFPTVGAAYRDGTYNAAQKYLGYWNSNTCYGYAGTSTDGYFTPSGVTTAQYECNVAGAGTGFSGNFLNFAATSSIDIFRYALTGGDRVVDEAARTVLQRAVLPGTPGDINGSFYGSGANFPTRTVAAGTAISRLTPFPSGATLFVKSCLNNVFFGTANTGSCTAPGNNANVSLTNTTGVTVTGTFKARVEVCTGAEGPSRTELCRQYPGGNYKPVGEIQKNSDKVRVAAFGYLLDQVNTRYGGVLRAPMKFAGATQRAANGAVSANPAAEWDALTGVFVAKPLDSATETGFTNSGVINYVNQFGRDGGFYKRFDPVGELYYETLRYFQGLQPTADATVGMTAAMMNNYPVYTSWDDPMQTRCQRNYTLVIGDNNTHRDAHLPGSGFAGQARGRGPGDPDAPYWTNILQSFETNAGTGYTDSQGGARTANGNPGSAGAPGVEGGNTLLATRSTGADNATFMWAGLAYWANTQSIRSDFPQARVRTFVMDVDEGGNGTLQRGRAFYLAGKYGGFGDVGVDNSASTGEGNPFQTWINGTLTASASEWLSADGSTSPSGYFLASQPERVITAVRKIFQEAAKPAGTLSGGSLSSSRFTNTANTGAYYRSRINTSDWSGTVVRLSVSLNTSTGITSVGTVPEWDAANILTGVQAGTTTLAPVPTFTDRNIYTSKRAGTATATTAATFTWANLDVAVQTSLRTDPATNVLGTTTDGINRMNWVRGDRSNEGTLRARRLIMGDMINSSPVYKAGASGTLTDAGYSTFYNTYKNRTGTVYVGANAGMLHAFHAGTPTTDPLNGRELFAYVPRAVSERLNKLTDPAYAKDAYVDASAVVGEAKFARLGAAVGWGTVLASGMGGGAQGLFALDVTNPSAFTSSNVLWEFTDADDPDMGNIISEPRIVKLAINGAAAAVPDYRWFIMTTSGYNNYKVDGSQSLNGKQHLFLLSLEKTAGTAWSLGSNYFKMTADDPAFTDTALATGMGQAGVATGTTGNVRIAYAGDLQGNLWRFNLTGNSTTWSSSANATKLFKAATAAAVPQPITVVPAVGLNPRGGYEIAFGTGKFIEPSDSLIGSAGTQSIYSVWDNGDLSTIGRQTAGSVNGLVSRTISVTPGSITSSISITGSPFFYGATVGSTYRGWYADLTTNMERIAIDPAFDGGVLAINSTIPGGDPCSPSGSGYPYRLNILKGTSLVTSFRRADGYLGRPSIAQTGSTWSARGVTGQYDVKKINTVFSPTTSGDVFTEKFESENLVGARVSWREIVDFRGVP